MENVEQRFILLLKLTVSLNFWPQMKKKKIKKTTTLAVGSDNCPLGTEAWGRREWWASEGSELQRAVAWPKMPREPTVPAPRAETVPRQPGTNTYRWVGLVGSKPLVPWANLSHAWSDSTLEKLGSSDGIAWVRDHRYQR